MSKKITKELFLKRFQLNYPEERIEILEYDSIKSPCTIKCLKCGRIQKKARAEEFIRSFTCCNKQEISKIDRVKEIYQNNGNEFSIIKQDKDPQYWIIKHNKCGCEMRRTAQAIFSNPFTCKNCETVKQYNRLSFEDASQQIKEAFNNSIQLLDFRGVDDKHSKYRCLQCGLIFEHSQYVLINKCRGCPKCDQRYSKGERFIEQLLIQKNIEYKKQVRFKELGQLKFDFGVYENNKLLYLIEVQGEQHYRPAQWPEGFQKRIERDNLKRKYCKENNILLYELPWDGRKFNNLDILPL